MTEQEPKIVQLEKEKRELLSKIEQETNARYALQTELGELKDQNRKFLTIIENLSKGRN